MSGVYRCETCGSRLWENLCPQCEAARYRERERQVDERWAEQQRLIDRAKAQAEHEACRRYTGERS